MADSQSNQNPIAHQPISSSDASRFMGHVEKSDQCWRWLACTDQYGYGITSIRGKSQKAHRVSYRIFKGDIPPGLLVMHSCDNPSCVNPDHLSVGTYKDNTADAVKKGRMASGDKNGSRIHRDRMPRGDASFARRHPELMPRGESNGRSRLSENSVIEIRKLYATGMYSNRLLASKYNVVHQLISRIIRREIWTHI